MQRCQAALCPTANIKMAHIGRTKAIVTYPPSCHQIPQANNAFRWANNGLGCASIGEQQVILLQVMSEQSSESAIINIAINIFQNVGIRRWIEQIEILKSQQIYFEICKIIFPQTIIQLFRLSENQCLSTGQKIQGVIDLISKLIKNDLYHISGEAIANGKPTHLKNFLQLLEALSNSMITKEKIEVQSAPENDQSFAYNDYNKSYYTVIGIDKEFGAMICYTEDEDQDLSKPKEPHIKFSDREHASSSQDGPSQLDPKNIPQQPAKTQKPREKHKEATQKLKKTPVFTPMPQESRESLPYPFPLHEKNRRHYEQENNKWVTLAHKMNETKLTLEREQLQSIKQSYLDWKLNHEGTLAGRLHMIQKESAMRKKMINEEINKREVLLNSLKGQAQAQKAIKNLFKQEKRVKALNRARQKAKEQENLNRLLDFHQFDVLLEKASRSAKPYLTAE